MADSTKSGMFLIALTVTWVCFSALIFHFSSMPNGITGSTVGIPTNPGMTLDDTHHVLVKPRGVHASKVIRSMDGVDVEDIFDQGFTAWVETDLLAEVTNLAEVYYLKD